MGLEEVLSVGAVLGVVLGGSMYVIVYTDLPEKDMYGSFVRGWTHNNSHIYHEDCFNNYKYAFAYLEGSMGGNQEFGIMIDSSRRNQFREYLEAKDPLEVKFPFIKEGEVEKFFHCYELGKRKITTPVNLKVL